MATKHWDVKLDEQRYTVKLKHEGLGKVKVFVGDEEITEGRTWGEGGDFPFEIGGRPAIVRVIPRLLGLDTDYELVVDGEKVA